MAGVASVKVDVSRDYIRQLVLAAIREGVACERDHVEDSATPRVVKDREDFEVGQAVALSSPPAIAIVTKAEGRHVEVEGQYLAGRRSYSAKVMSPLNGEIAKGLWVILKDAPPEVRR